MTPRNMIEIEHLTKTFGDLTVLRDLSLSVPVGETAAIVGPSGTGKSTLLRCLNLLETPSSGKITINGLSVTAEDLTQKEIYAFRRNSTMIFQNFNLFANKNVLDNITLAMRVVKKIDRKEAQEEAFEILKKVGMEDKADAYPATLSGGQQQRVAIGRALAMHTQVMLFDEPTSALDPSLVGEVLRVIRDIAKEHKTTILIVTHEMHFAREVADRILFLDHGSVVEDAPPDDFFDHPSDERTKAFLRYYEGR